MLTSGSCSFLYLVVPEKDGESDLNPGNIANHGHHGANDNLGFEMDSDNYQTPKVDIPNRI